MPKFKVTFVERQKDGTTRKIEQNAICKDRKQVIDWYGLEEPDIVSYEIEIVE